MTTLEYKGPSVHKRVITQKDLEASGVEFKDGEKIDDLVWEAGNARLPLTLKGKGDSELSSETKDAVLAVLKKEKTFTIKDGDDTTEADPEAGHVLADGSSAANGEGGSEALSSAIGGSTGGDTTTSGRTSTTGGSTRTR